ncbi:MAG: hypothetical protein AM324_012950 [Candidatus Thorarchaeota archaeon SMTZ1-83]
MYRKSKTQSCGIVRGIAIILLLIAMTLHQLPTARADSQLVIPPGGHETLSWGVWTQGRGLFGDFEVINGSDITFFICNQSAFNDWTGGHSIQAYEVMEDVTSGEYEYLGGRGTTWYLVFDNTDEVSTTQTVKVNFHIDLTAPTIECSIKNNDVVSGPCEITITATDRFKVYSIAYTIAASSYPNSFDPITRDVRDMDSDSISFNLNTTQMENGTYYISIVVKDVSYNERHMVVDFRVENEYDPTLGIVRVLTNPFVVAFIPLGVLGLIVVLRRRQRIITDSETEHLPSPDSTEEVESLPSEDTQVQERALEEEPVTEETTRPELGRVPVDLRVVAFMIGALALFAPYMLVLQLDQGTFILDAMTWRFTRSDSYWWLTFMVDYMIMGTVPFTVWRAALVYQMYRYYQGRSTRRTTFLLAVVAEMIMVTADLVIYYLIFPGYWGPLLTIPTPLMLVGASVFLWMTPYPVPKTPFDDQTEPEKWWEQDTETEGIPPKQAAVEDQSQDGTAPVVKEDGGE